MSADLAARALARRALKAVGDTQGADAYEVAVAEGFVGSRQAWLASLKGEDGVGSPGKDAYQLAVDAGFVGSRTAWLASLKGEDGIGAPGKDAYQVAVDAGFVGDRAAWLASLQGPPGQEVDPAALAELQESLTTALERLAVLESPDTLSPLSLEPSSVPEDAQPGELVGHVTGLHPFEQLTLVDDAGGRLAYVDGAVYAGETPLEGQGGSSLDLVLERRLAKPGKQTIELEATLAIAVTEALVLEELPLEDLTVSLDVATGAELAVLGPLLPGETRSIVPNDGRVVFNAEQTALLRGLTAWSAGVTEYTVHREHPNASNSPLGTSWILTVAAGGPAYDVLVHSAAELTAALAEHGVAGGKTIAIAFDAAFEPGFTFTQKPLLPLTIISEPHPTQMAALPNIVLSDAERLIFDGLKLGNEASTAANVTTADGKGSKRCTFLRCEFFGPWIDPEGDYGYSGIKGIDAGWPHITAPTTVQPTTRGVDSATNGYHEDLTVQWCRFHDLQDGIKLGGYHRGQFHYDYNDFDKIYVDAVHIGWRRASPPLAGSTIRFNRFKGALGLKTDYGDIHQDAIQFTIQDESGVTICPAVLIIGNVIWNSQATRGQFQPFLIQDLDNGKYDHFIIAHNMVVEWKQNSHVLMAHQQSGGYVWDHRVFRETPGLGGGSLTYSFLTSTAPDTERTFFGACVGEVLPAGSFDSGGLMTQLPNIQSAYEALCEGPFGGPPPTTWEELFARYRYKAAGALGALREAVNYEERTFQAASEPAHVRFPSLFKQAQGARVNSGWKLVQGGGLDQLISIAGDSAQYRIADDASGANATALTAAPGIVDEGQYLWVEFDTSDEPATTSAATVTINGRAISFKAVTPSAQGFNLVSFDGAGDYLVKAGGLAGVTASKKFTLVYVGATPSRPTAANYHLLGLTNSRVLVTHLSTSGALRFRIRNAAGDLVLSTDVSLGAWEGQVRTLAVSCDAAAAQVAGGVLASLDGVNVSPTTGTLLDDLFDFGVATEWNIYKGANSPTYRTDSGLFYFLPGVALDVTDAAVLARFLPDNIGPNGEGPTGAPPPICIMGDAASINAGVGNKGTGGAFTRVGGLVDA